MINLLPPENRESTKYAYKNTVLRKYAASLFVLLLAVIVVFLGGAIYLKQSSIAVSRQVDSTQAQLDLEDRSKIKSDVSDLTDTFKLVVEVLSDQVLFSKLINQVGAVIPDGAVLSNLSINELSGDLDLQVNTVDYETATQVQVNLEDPDNLLFENADIINITCQSTDTTKVYPCTVLIKALFGEASQFLLINNDGEASND